ncbi:MAG: hypothetical protein QOI78_4865 [Actinomycetota bacterium]|nr:hypothetical protein [Actinomycetota bacterium]
MRHGLRAVAVYGLLVVIPVLVAVVLLTREDNGEGVPSKPAAAAGHPVAQLPLAIAVVIAACKVAGWVMRRIGRPSVVGEIAAGIVLGPSVLGMVWPACASALLPAVIMPR